VAISYILLSYFAAVGCFNMNYYVWLDSTACLCTQQLVVDLQTAAKNAFLAVVWTLGAMACICFGSLLAGLQASADMALMTSEWRWSRRLAKAQSNARQVLGLSTSICVEPST